MAAYRNDAALSAAINRTEEVTQPLIERIGALADREGDMDLSDIAEALQDFDNIYAPFAGGIFTRAISKAMFVKGLRPVRHEWHVTLRNFEGKRLDQLVVWFELEGSESALVCTAKDRTCGRFGLYKDDDKRLRNALGFRA